MNDEIRIVDFRPEHFYAMQLRKEDAADLAGIDMAHLFQSWQQGRTIIKEGKTAFIYGFGLNCGIMTLWAVTSPLVNGMPLLITRLARNGIKAGFKAGAHRIEIYCHIGNIRSLAWLTRSLGFRIEGLMRKSGPNKQDRFLLALTDTDYTEGKK